MNDNEILTHIEHMGWAAVSIDSTKLGPGRDNWQQSLDELTPEQRALLEEKIARCEAKLKGTILA